MRLFYDKSKYNLQRKLLINSIPVPLIFIQFLLPCEKACLTRLHAMASAAEIVTCNQSVHQCLQNEHISHTFHPPKHRDWPQINRDIFDFLENNNTTESTHELPEMMDTWSHWLVSEINLISQISEAIVSVCRNRKNTTLVIKHALEPEAYTTMQQALLCHGEKSISNIVDWDNFNA